MTETGTRTGFRPDIEGLRAVAVLAVVLFHAGVPGLPGGFVGVDVFFVVSGFLITGLLWREVQATGTVRLARFYGARARRLLPAGIVVLLATAAASAWLLPPLQARAVLGDAVASALYAGNYRFAVQGTDYLASDTPPSPFQHYWSLGVEEQFYLVWPALLILTAWALVRRRRGAPSSVVPFVVVLGLVAAASFAVSYLWTATLPSWAFFSLPSRAWELAVGGLVALTVGRWRRLPSWAAAAAGWTGLGLVVVGCVRLGESTAYPGTAALLPVLGTALVVGAGAGGSRWGAGALLSVAPMRAVGRLSYSWYLWHWPVLLLAPYVVEGSLGLAGRLATAVLAAGLAMLTLQFVENPVRFAAPLRRSAGRSLILGGSVTAAGVAAGLVLLAVVPVPVGRGAAAAEPTIEVAEPPAAPVVDPQEAAVQALTAQVQAAVAAAAGVRAVPSNLSPPLAEAPAAKPAVFVNGCTRSWLGTGQDECASGDLAAGRTMALVGDSHAAMWQPGLETVAAQQGWRLETMAKVLCPMLDLPTQSPYLGREYTECHQWRAEIMDRLRAERPALIVVDMVRRYTPDYGFTVYGPEWLAAVTRTVAELRSTGAVVLVLGPVPDPHGNVPTCLSDHLDSAMACAPARAVGMDDAGIAAEAEATAAGGGQYATVTDLFCTPAVCPVVVGNQLVFRDDNHLSIDYARFLAPVLAALVDRAMTGA
ncbi:acyltransferase family protein [Blastococcus deserti]|uniref:Acyltransferase family protein n=1 Tax=Blastococcus deserti TaxID=2259033 RepID=A0ABW4X6Q5_9ACTN